MAARRKLTLKTKLAATLCQLVRYDDNEACFVRIIPHERAKEMSEDEVLSMFDWHHYPIPKAHGGEDLHWNLQPETCAAHDEITAKIDIPRIAKGKRITAKQEEFRRRLLAKDKGEARPPSRWGKRKLQSRSSFERREAR